MPTVTRDMAKKSAPKQKPTKPKAGNTLQNQGSNYLLKQHVNINLLVGLLLVGELRGANHHHQQNLRSQGRIKIRQKQRQKQRRQLKLI